MVDGRRGFESPLSAINSLQSFGRSTHSGDSATLWMLEAGGAPNLPLIEI